MNLNNSSSLPYASSSCLKQYCHVDFQTSKQVDGIALIRHIAVDYVMKAAAFHVGKQQVGLIPISGNRDYNFKTS